jgi:TonB family protein
VINVKLLSEAKPPPKQEPKMEATARKQKTVEKEEKPAKPKMTYKSKKTETKKTSTGKQSKTTGKKPKASAPKVSSDSGTKSKIRVDDKDFRFAYYLEIIKDRISQTWSPPPVSGSAGGVTSTVYFKISRDGSVSDLKIEKNSAFDLFDRSAVRAVELSSPLPPLPAGFTGRWLGVHFEFEHTSG